MKTTTLLIGGFAAALSLAAGCDAGPDTEDSEFRYGWHNNFWNYGWSNPANGDTQVTASDDVSPFDLIWDVDDGTTSQSVGEGGSELPVSSVIRQTVADEILDAEGELLCTAVQTQSSGRRAYQLLDGNGDAIMTLWHRFVFAGDVHIPQKGWKLSKLIKHHTLYSFHHNRIYDGVWWDAEVLATADTKISRANPMRKLELASLVAGECGSHGI